MPQAPSHSSSHGARRAVSLYSNGPAYHSANVLDQASHSGRELFDFICLWVERNGKLRRGKGKLKQLFWVVKVIVAPN